MALTAAEDSGTWTWQLGGDSVFSHSELDCTVDVEGESCSRRNIISKVWKALCIIYWKSKLHPK